MSPHKRKNQRQRFWGRKGGESYGGNYSTVKNAERLSATLSIRPSGRLQIIDV